MYYFTNPNEFTNRNRIFLNRNTSVRISEDVLYYIPLITLDLIYLLILLLQFMDVPGVSACALVYRVKLDEIILCLNNFEYMCRVMY